MISTNITSSQAQDLACTFVKWFYEMINGFCSSPSAASCAATEFRPDHFFSDADAKIAIQASTCDSTQPGDDELMVFRSSEADCKARSGATTYHHLFGMFFGEECFSYNFFHRRII